MAFHAVLGVDFVIRAPSNHTFKEVEGFARCGETERVVTIEVTQRQKDFVKEHGLPETIQVRLVRVALDDGTVEVLMTSLVDTEEYPAEEFKGLYGKRWGVETYFDWLKNLLEVERFSSRKVVGIEQDFYGIVFMSTLASVLMKEEEEAADRWSEERRLKYRYKVNRSVRYSALVDQVVDLLLNECKSSEEAEEELRTMLRRMWIPERPGRRTKRPAKSTSRQLRFQQYVKRIWT